MEFQDFYCELFTDPKQVKDPKRRIVSVDCSNIFTARDFYKVLADSLELAEYFGNNLDALFDVLTDDQVLGKNGVALVFTHTDSWLEQEDYEMAADVLICMHDAGQDLTDMRNQKLRLCFEQSDEIVDFFNSSDIPFTIIQ